MHAHTWTKIIGLESSRVTQIIIICYKRDEVIQEAISVAFDTKLEISSLLNLVINK